MVYYGNCREVRDATRQADTNLTLEAKAVFTNPRNVSKRLQQYCKLDSTPLYHPPNNPDAFCGEEAEDYFPPLSRINASKRQLLAIQAFAQVSGNTKLVFCGESEDDTYYKKMQQEVYASGLEGRVKFHGRVSEKENIQLYACCLGVIYPPFDEDYGYVTLEAMLSSKPVITCDDSGSPLEFIEDDGNGYVVKAEPAAIVEAMIRLRDNRTRATELGQAGRRDDAEKRITWEGVVEQIVA